MTRSAVFVINFKQALCVVLKIYNSFMVFYRLNGAKTKELALTYDYIRLSDLLLACWLLSCIIDKDLHQLWPVGSADHWTCCCELVTSLLVLANVGNFRKKTISPMHRELPITLLLQKPASHLTEAYSEPCQTSKIGFFAKIVNCF